MSELLAALRAPARTLMDAVPLPMGAQDPEGRIVYVNAALLRTVGVEAACLLGRYVQEWIPEAARDIHESHLTRWSRGEATLLELSLPRAGVGPEPHLFLPGPIVDRKAGYLGVIGIFVPCAAAAAATDEHLRDSEALALSVLEAVTQLRDVARSLPPRTLEEQRELDPALASLSAREFEVARRIAAGERTGDIAVALGIRPNTVRNHLKAMFRKLDVDRQATLIARLRAGARGRAGP